MVFALPKCYTYHTRWSTILVCFNGDKYNPRIHEMKWFVTPNYHYFLELNKMHGNCPLKRVNDDFKCNICFNVGRFFFLFSFFRSFKWLVYDILIRFFPLIFLDEFDEHETTLRENNKRKQKKKEKAFYVSDHIWHMR